VIKLSKEKKVLCFLFHLCSSQRKKEMKKGGHNRCIKARQINCWSKRLRFGCPSGSVSQHSVILDDFGSVDSPKVKYSKFIIYIIIIIVIY